MSQAIIKIGNLKKQKEITKSIECIALMGCHPHSRNSQAEVDNIKF